MDSGRNVAYLYGLGVDSGYVIDMGPGGGEDGGRIVACGMPEEIRNNKESITGRYL